MGKHHGFAHDQVKDRPLAGPEQGAPDDGTRAEPGPVPTLSQAETQQIRLKCLEIAGKTSPDINQVLAAAMIMEKWVLTGK